MSRFLPQQFTAGDTVQFSASFADYEPSDGYALTYYLRGAENLTITGSANGANDGWVVKIPAARTENFPEGLYEYIARATKDEDAYTVEQGRFTLKANLADVAQGTRIDHVQRMISILQDAIEGRITDDVQQFTIGGRSLMHIPVSQLVDLRDRYKRELVKLQKGTGGQQMQNHKVVFTHRE